MATDPRTGLPLPASPVSPAPPTAAPLVFPPARPLHESTSTSEQKIESPASAAARLGEVAAEEAVATAREAVTDVNARIAGTEAAGATAVAGQMKKDIAAKREREANDEVKRQQFLDGLREGIEKRTEAKKKAGAARADFWDGNAAGEVAVAIFRGIQSGIQSYRGQSGPTDAERIVEAKLAAHERKLIGAWEAEEENQRLKKEDFDRWEAGRALVAAKAAAESAEEIALIKARAEAFAKSLTPEQQRAMGDLTAKLETLENRHRDRKFAEGYDKSVKFSSTNRSESGSGGAAARADDTIAFDPKTGEPMFRTTTNQQAKEINSNGATIVKVTNDAREFAEIMRKLPKGAFLPGAGVVLSEEQNILKQRADLLRNGMKGQLTQSTGAGAPTGQEGAAFEAALDRGNFQSPEEHAKALEEAAKSIERKFYDSTRAFGNKGAEGETLRAQAAKRMGIKEDSGGKPKPDRALYDKAIAKAKAAGRNDLVKKLEAELGAAN